MYAEIDKKTGSNEEYMLYCFLVFEGSKLGFSTVYEGISVILSESSGWVGHWSLRVQSVLCLIDVRSAWSELFIYTVNCDHKIWIIELMKFLFYPWQPLNLACESCHDSRFVVPWWYNFELRGNKAQSSPACLIQWLILCFTWKCTSYITF